MRTLIKYYLPYLASYKRHFLLVFIGSILYAAGTTASAHLLKPVLDRLFIAKESALLYLLPLSIVAVFAIKSVGRFIQTYYTVYIGSDIVRRLRDKLSLHIMHLDMADLTSMRSGELLSRITADVMRIQTVVSSMIPLLIINLLLVLFLIAYVIWLSPKLAFYFLVIMPLAFLPLQILAKRMKRYSLRSQESASDMSARLNEIFHNIETIKANSSQRFEQERFEKQNRNFFRYSMKQAKVQALVGPVMEIFGSVAIAFAIYVGAKEVMSGAMSVGSFFAFFTALFLLYDPIKKLSAIHNQLQDAIAATERVDALLQHKREIVSGDRQLDKIDTIVFEGVSLSYDDLPVLHAINVSTKKGKIYALVGDSGAGKSSFVNLLVRFYDPSNGAIKIDGVDIREFDIETLHRKIAYVTQRIYLFNDTIAENVAYAQTPDRERVIEALKKAHAWEFISALPHGIDTLVEEGGGNLSGGQRQRIALARALYKEPEVLILDEATSALDNKSEAAIQRALEEIKSEMITFVVAHRLSTIEDADEIWLFEKGEIVAKGSYYELLKRSEKFRLLAQKV